MSRLKKEDQLKINELLEKVTNDDFETLNEIGSIYHEAGFIKKAMSFYKKAIKLNPSYVVTYYNIGLVYEELQNYEEAISFYKKAIELDSSDADSFCCIGNVYSNLNNYDEAIVYYKKAIELNSSDGRYYHNLGVVYEKLQNYDQAINCYNKAIELNQTFVNSYIGIVNICVQQRNYDEAIIYYKKIIELNPSDANAYRYIGDAYKELQNYEEAISFYKKAIELNPYYEGVYYNLGNVYYFLDNFNEAIICFNKVIELNPSYADAYCCIGNAYYNLCNYDEAIIYYKKAIEIDPLHEGCWRYYYNLGIIYKILQNYDETIYCYNEAIKFNQSFSKIYERILDVYNELQDFNKAISYFKTAIERNPSNEHLYFYLGIVYYFLKNYNEAIICYKKVIELNKSRDTSYWNLGFIYETIYEYDLAALNYKRAYDLSKNSNYCFYIGKFLDIYPNNSIFDKTAIEFIKEAVEKDHYDAFVYYSSYYYDNKISIDDAIKTLEICIEKFKDKKHLTEAYFELGKLYSEPSVLNKELALKYFELASNEGYDCTYETLRLENSNNNSYKEIINTINKEDIFNSNKMYEICENIIGDSFIKLQDNSKSFINRAIRAYVLETHSDNEEEDFSASLVYLGKALELELNLYLGEEVKKYIKNNELNNLEIGQMIANSNSFKTINQVIYPYKKKKDQRLLDKVLVDSLLKNVFKDNAFGNANQEINLSNYLFNFHKEINNFTDKRNTAAHKGHINQQQCEKWFDKMIGSGRMLQNFLAKLR